MEKSCKNCKYYPILQLKRELANVEERCFLNTQSSKVCGKMHVCYKWERKELT